MKITKKNPIDKTSVYLCAGLVSGAGALLLNVLPVLFGAFAERFGLGEHQLGNLAMAMNLGFGAFGAGVIAVDSPAQLAGYFGVVVGAGGGRGVVCFARAFL
jgi:hypothetical protein